MQVAAHQMTSQFPEMRRRFAQQMADHQRRLAERLLHERESRSLSRDDLAYKTGVSAKTIKRIETQVTEPRPVTVRRLAEGLGINPAELRPPDELEVDQLERIEQKIERLERIANERSEDQAAILAAIEQLAGSVAELAAGLEAPPAARSRQR
jgi:transcriptional regulator with XRE-family HTH domain